jgi:hypothetical protein
MSGSVKGPSIGSAAYDKSYGTVAFVKRVISATFAILACAASPASAATGQWPCEREVGRAHAAAQITEEQRAQYLAAVAAAKSTRSVVGGVRRRELAGAITIANRLAERGTLTASRMPSVFLTLQRNAEYWRSNDPPKRPAPTGQCDDGVGYSLPRVTFGDDPVVFQHYPGNGLQVQWLGNFGAANALAGQCLAQPPNRKAPCRADKLKALLDRLVALRSQRGDGFTAWEYTFPFGGGAPPWVSGMAQATALQALARGSQVLGDPSYLDVARTALGAFRSGPPAGTRVPSGDGSHYLIYSFGGLRVLNAFLQSLIGLYDYATISGDAEAMELFQAGDRAAQREIPRYDTGAWSRYSLGGGEANLDYHKLVRDFLQRLCDRTQAAVYCTSAARFSSYLKQPPAMSFAPAAQPRRRRPATVRVRISKISCVKVAVWRGERLLLARRYVFAAGRRSFTFVPPARGRYRVAVDARDLAGNRAVIRRSLRAR